MFGLGSSDKAPDAIDLLKTDHDEVDTMFKQYEELKEKGSADAKRSLVAQICDSLSVHAQIEEELFYPAARRARDVEDDLIDEAAVEHQTLKDIIARLRAAPVSDPLYDAGVKVLSEYTKHHVREEETELFPEVRKSAVDLDKLGQELRERKEALIAAGNREMIDTAPASAMKRPAAMRQAPAEGSRSGNGARAARS